MIINYLPLLWAVLIVFSLWFLVSVLFWGIVVVSDKK